tara:strand:+ start:10893 stop:11411 length:519 start_codon:yes stop_codon:yes gene_type:complete
MATNKKPRKPYVRKPVNLMSYMEVQDRMRLLTHHDDTRNKLITLKIRNHDAISNLRIGCSTGEDIKNLIRAVNMSEALMLFDIGAEYKKEHAKAKEAVKNICSRAFDRHKFILTARELEDINLFMEIHDAQLEVCTLQEFNNACEVVNKSIRTGKSEKLEIYRNDNKTAETR